jgi:hypothetical protein
MLVRSVSMQGRELVEAPSHVAPSGTDLASDGPEGAPPRGVSHAVPGDAKRDTNGRRRADQVLPPAASVAPQDGGRGRRKTAAERRTVTKLVRLSPAEARRIERRALACGRPPAVFLREAALGAVPRPRQTAAIDPVIADLVRLGTTLRRLRDTDGPALSADAVHAAFDAALGAVLDTVRGLEGRGAEDAGTP